MERRIVFAALAFVCLFGIIFAVFSVGVVSAAPYSSSSIGSSLMRTMGTAVDSVVSAGYPIFSALIGDYNESIEGFTSNEVFFIRVLILLLLFVVARIALLAAPMFRANRGVATLISGVFAIIAVRFISQSQMLYGILLPYGVAGIALTTILPFLIFFWFVHSTGMGSVGRRLAWMFFAVVFIALLISRYEMLSETGRYIYIAAIALTVISFLMDREIHRYFAVWELNAFYRGANQKTIAALQAEYLNIINVNTPAAEARKRAIETQLRALGAALP